MYKIPGISTASTPLSGHLSTLRRIVQTKNGGNRYRHANTGNRPNRLVKSAEYTINSSSELAIFILLWTHMDRQRAFINKWLQSCPWTETLFSLPWDFRMYVFAYFVWRMHWQEILHLVQKRKITVETNCNIPLFRFLNNFNYLKTCMKHSKEFFFIEDNNNKKKEENSHLPVTTNYTFWKNNNKRPDNYMKTKLRTETSTDTSFPRSWLTTRLLIVAFDSSSRWCGFCMTIDILQ